MGRNGFAEAILLLSVTAAQHAALVALTPRDAEVLSWLAKGKTNREIPHILGIRPRTVNKHPEHIFEKLGRGDAHRSRGGRGGFAVARLKSRAAA